MSFSNCDSTAQNIGSCDSTFFYSKTNKKLTYVSYNKDSIVQWMEEETVLLITNTEKGFEAIVATNSVNANNRGKEPSQEFKVRCENGNLEIDLSTTQWKALMLQIGTHTAEEIRNYDSIVSYPSKIIIGQKLRDYKFLDISSTNEIKNRTVEAFEKIKTKAGTFDCFKITYDSESTYEDKKEAQKVTEWWALGVGLIKSLRVNSLGELTNRRELTILER